ncbi:MAG: hypothetical protein Q7R90_04570 [bacterium]|nr:hypothetical protein [bacterium]
MQRRILFMQAVVVAVIGVLDVYFGVGQSYFWTIWWWDILLHVLGGVWAGLLGAWVAGFFGIRITLVRCALFALAIGVSWETFEYINSLGGSVFMSYTADIIKDLFDDTLGGALAYYLVQRKRV